MSGGDLKRSAQQRLHLLSWRAPLECFPRAAVELGGDLVKLDLAARSQVELAGQVLTEQPVGVLVRSALPRRAGVAEVDLDAGVAAESLVGRELLALVRGLRSTAVVGGDVVEVSPAYDHAEITAVAAAHVLYDLVTIMAAPQRA